MVELEDFSLMVETVFKLANLQIIQGPKTLTDIVQFCLELEVGKFAFESNF